MILKSSNGAALEFCSWWRNKGRLNWGGLCLIPRKSRLSTGFEAGGVERSKGLRRMVEVQVERSANWTSLRRRAAWDLARSNRALRRT